MTAPRELMHLRLLPHDAQAARWWVRREESDVLASPGARSVA